MKGIFRARPGRATHPASYLQSELIDYRGGAMSKPALHPFMVVAKLIQLSFLLILKINSRVRHTSPGPVCTGHAMTVTAEKV